MIFFIWRKNYVSFSRYLDFFVFVKSKDFKICDIIIDIDLWLPQNVRIFVNCWLKLVSFLPDFPWPRCKGMQKSNSQNLCSHYYPRHISWWQYRAGYRKHGLLKGAKIFIRQLYALKTLLFQKNMEAWCEHSSS